MLKNTLATINVVTIIAQFIVGYIGEF